MSSQQETFKVAVIGNAPFMEYDYNTSALVRDALPDTIERPNKKSIRILKYDRDTRDTYEDVRHVSREICSGESSIYRPVSHSDQEKDPKHSRKVRVDLIVHLGMVALGWRPDQFRFETVARRDGYELAGDDGKHVDSAGLKSLGLPESLATSLDVQAAWTKVKDKFPDKPIFVSNDAGLYFCEFRMYSSLAEPLLQDESESLKGQTVFVHLPQDHNDEAIALAQHITATYIEGLADDALYNDTM